MNRLTFTIDSNREDADFLIEYYNPKNWNESYYYVRYRIIALPRLTGKERIPIRGIMIVSTKQNQSEKDALSRLMADTPVFEELPNHFISIITGERAARYLFVLLSPEQRIEFAKSLRLCLTEEDCLAACKRQSSITKEFIARKTILRGAIAFKTEKKDGQISYTAENKAVWKQFMQERMLIVSNHILSPVDYRLLPKF